MVSFGPVAKAAEIFRHALDAADICAS